MSVSPTRFVRRSRVGFLFSIVLVVSAIFVVQLFVVQVVRHDYYVAQADNEQIKKFTLKAQRGEIYAMDGSDPKPLVMNETVYKVWADPTQVSDKQAVVDTLPSIYHLPVYNILPLSLSMSLTANYPNSFYPKPALKAKHNLLSVVLSYIRDIQFDSEATRHYQEIIPYTLPHVLRHYCPLFLVHMR